MRRRSLLAAAALLALSAAASAQPAPPMFGGFMAASNDPIEIDAQTLQQTEQDGRQILEYSGGVSASRGEMTIRADRLTVYLPAPGGDADVTFERIEASGNVSIASGPQRATANQAVMDMVAQTVVMTGNVQLADGTNQMSGQTFTVNLATGGWRMETGGNTRVQTTITPGAR